jgi:RNA polymerase sigma factor (sigma-70 family)
VTLHDPAHLLDQAAWLRTLAQSLVGDRATADDLVQDTYVAALGRPPSMDRPVKPWLSRVLRNAARFRWRSETNRSTREAALARTAERETLTSAELLERHETQQMLARLVGELEEPYREVILLRFAGVASLWGFVRDTEGAPIAGARVLREDVLGAESDALRAYEVCALPTATDVAQLLFTIRADGYGAITSRWRDDARRGRGNRAALDEPPGQRRTPGIYARRRRHPHRFGHRGVTGRTPEYGEVARPHTCAYDAHV